MTKSDDALESLLALAETTERALARQNVPHLSREDTRRLFAQRHSRDATSGPRSESVLIEDRLNQALDAIAQGDLKHAQRLLEEALAAGATALDGINRDERSAKQLFHACLLAVQVRAEQGDEASAREQARSCVVQSPGMTLPPSDRSYLPIVRTLLTDVQTERAKSDASHLTVESTPSGCPVYLNGKQRGVTPYTHRVLTQVPHLVQVECQGGSAPGRVYTITPDGPSTIVKIDAELDAVLRTTSGALRLVDSGPSHDRLRKHLRSVQDVLEVPFLLVLTRPQHGRLALQRVGGGSSATVQLAEGYSEHDLDRALEQLVAPMIATSVADAPQTDVLPPPAPRRVSKVTKALGMSALIGGLTMSGLGFWRYRAQRERADSYVATDRADPSYYERGVAWSDARTLPYAFVAAGSALSLGGSLWLSLAKPRPRLPWWTTALAGTLGTGLASWGAVQLARGGACGAEREPDTRACAGRRDDRDLGALLLVSAAPALGVFLMESTRLAQGRRKTDVVLRPDVQGAMITVRHAL